MTIFELIAMVFGMFIQMLKDFDILYGVTGWQLVMIFIVGTDLALIIKYGIIGSKKDAGGDI